MQKARYKYADVKDFNQSIEEKVALLPLQAIRFIFKNHIGTLPYEVEDIMGQQLLYYSGFEVK